MRKLLNYYTRKELGEIFQARPVDILKRKTLTMTELEKLTRIWAEPIKQEPKSVPKRQPKFNPEPLDPRLPHLRIYHSGDFFIIKNTETGKKRRFWSYWVTPPKPGDEADAWSTFLEIVELVKNPKYMNGGRTPDRGMWEWLMGERKKMETIVERYEEFIADPELRQYIREKYPPQPWAPPKTEKTNE